MFLIHTALPFEAHPIIRNLGLKQTGSPSGGRLYTDKEHQYALLVSGVGGEKTRKTLKALYERLRSRNLSITKTLNIGLAADPGKRFAIGTALKISSVYRFNHQEPTFDLFTLNNDLSSATLCTIDVPCSDPAVFTKSESIPLLDMEAWYFVDTLINSCDLSQSDICSIKVISDYADEAPFHSSELAPIYDGTIDLLLQCIRKRKHIIDSL